MPLRFLSSRHERKVKSNCYQKKTTDAVMSQRKEKRNGGHSHRDEAPYKTNITLKISCSAALKYSILRTCVNSYNNQISSLVPLFLLLPSSWTPSFKLQDLSVCSQTIITNSKDRLIVIFFLWR